MKDTHKGLVENITMMFASASLGLLAGASTDNAVVGFATGAFSLVVLEGVRRISSNTKGFTDWSILSEPEPTEEERLYGKAPDNSFNRSHDNVFN